MSFLTTVKSTGELFDAITDLGVDKKLTGDAQLPLQPISFMPVITSEDQRPIQRSCTLSTPFTPNSAATNLRNIVPPVVRWGDEAHSGAARRVYAHQRRRRLARRSDDGFAGIDQTFDGIELAVDAVEVAMLDDDLDHNGKGWDTSDEKELDGGH
jgi:hypothetical protein